MKLSDLRRISKTLGARNAPPDPLQMASELAALGYDPNNLYQELEMESRFVDTHQDTSYSNAMLSLHSHTFYELLYCRNSCGAEYLVGAERYRLQKGDIVLIAPGISHRPLLPERMPEPYKRDVLWISTEFMPLVRQVLPDLRAPRLQESSLLRTAGTQWEFLGELFHKGVAEAEAQAPGWELAVMGNTMTLMTQLYRAVWDRSTAPLKAEKPDLLDQILAYIEAHLAEKITLAEVAHHFFVSESTVTQLFRKKLDVSFYRCVTQRRLIAAKALIEEGLLLETVSDRVGFSDYSVFYRAFKQEYGISPKRYRQLQEASSRNTL